MEVFGRRRGGTPGTPVACRALGSRLKPGGEKELCSSSSVGFHTFAGLGCAPASPSPSYPEACWPTLSSESVLHMQLSGLVAPVSFPAASAISVGCCMIRGGVAGARLPLFYPRPSLLCPRAAALTYGYCTSPHGCDNTISAGVLLAMLSGVRTWCVPVLLVCPPAAATLLWFRAALVLHQTSLVPCVW